MQDRSHEILSEQKQVSNGLLRRKIDIDPCEIRCLLLRLHWNAEISVTRWLDFDLFTILKVLNKLSKYQTLLKFIQSGATLPNLITLMPTEFPF